MVLSDEARKNVIEKRAFEAKVAKDRADERITKSLWGEAMPIVADNHSYGSAEPKI